MNRKFFGRWEFLTIFSQKSHDDMSLCGGGGNRKNFCEKVFGVNAISAQQPRGSRIEIVDSTYSPDVPVAGADALVTKEENLGLIIGMADCYGVVLMDPIGGVLANIHAGRQGIIGKIIPKTVAVMEGLGTVRHDVHMLIGPGICGKCYRVGKEDVYAWGFETYKQYVSDVPGRPDERLIDLRAIIEHQLIEEAGLRRKKIEHLRICTFEDRNYFSYRRALANGNAVGGQEEDSSQRGVCVAVMKAA